jgi:Ribosomal protein L1
MKRGKRYSKCLGLYDRNRLYSVEEAVQILKKLHAECGSRFDQTVELAMRLGVTPSMQTRWSGVLWSCPTAWVKS